MDPELQVFLATGRNTFFQTVSKDGIALGTCVPFLPLLFFFYFTRVCVCVCVSFAFAVTWLQGQQVQRVDTRCGLTAILKGALRAPATRAPPNIPRKKRHSIVPRAYACVCVCYSFGSTPLTPRGRFAIAIVELWDLHDPTL